MSMANVQGVFEAASVSQILATLDRSQFISIGPFLGNRDDSDALKKNFKKFASDIDAATKQFVEVTGMDPANSKNRDALEPDVIFERFRTKAPLFEITIERYRASAKYFLSVVESQAASNRVAPEAIANAAGALKALTNNVAAAPRVLGL